jgi:hypothetical protein
LSYWQDNSISALVNASFPSIDGFFEAQLSRFVNAWAFPTTSGTIILLQATIEGEKPELHTQHKLSFTARPIKATHNTGKPELDPEVTDS